MADDTKGKVAQFRSFRDRERELQVKDMRFNGDLTADLLLDVEPELRQAFLDALTARICMHCYDPIGPNGSCSCEVDE